MIDISACNVVYLKCRSLLSAWSYQKAPWSKADATTFDTEQEVILMKIERINENQIRCTLTSFDLSARNINLVELAYGTEKARKLFREMIQKASNEVGFEAEDIPLMVEAIPLSSESIMLVITKIEDPEELDTRFAKFSPFTDDNQNSLVSQLASEFLEGAPDSLNYLEPGSVEQVGDESSADSASEAAVKKNTGSVASSRIFRFNSLDRISEASRAVSGIYDGVNTLYKKPGTRQYYLIVKRLDCGDLDFSRVCNILAEYATKLSGESASEAYFKEHYEVIIQDNALQNLARI